MNALKWRAHSRSNIELSEEEEEEKNMRIVDCGASKIIIWINLKTPFNENIRHSLAQTMAAIPEKKNITKT